MSPLRAHFNTSTLKAGYKSATNKALLTTFENYVADDCECWGPGLTPKYYSVTLAGITSCSPKNGAKVNGEHTLVKVSSDAGTCLWQKLITDDYVVSLELIYGTPRIRIIASTYEPSLCNCFTCINNDTCANLITDNCSNGYTSCSGSLSGYGGTASWTPKIY